MPKQLLVIEKLFNKPPYLPFKASAIAFSANSSITNLVVKCNFCASFSLNLPKK